MLLAAIGVFAIGVAVAAFAVVLGSERWLMTAAYAPLLAWGPLLGVTTIAYWRRRRRR